jgi:hypothetical protein
VHVLIPLLHSYVVKPTPTLVCVHITQKTYLYLSFYLVFYYSQPKSSLFTLTAHMLTGLFLLKPILYGLFISDASQCELLSDILNQILVNTEMSETQVGTHYPIIYYLLLCTIMYYIFTLILILIPTPIPIPIPILTPTPIPIHLYIYL